MIISSIFEFLACVLLIYGFIHEKELIAFEHACYVHFKRWLQKGAKK